MNGTVAVAAIHVNVAVSDASGTEQTAVSFGDEAKMKLEGPEKRPARRKALLQTAWE